MPKYVLYAACVIMALRHSSVRLRDFCHFATGINRIASFDAHIEGLQHERTVRACSTALRP